MLRKTLIPILFLLSGCQSLPPPPKGDTCIVDVQAGGADCVSISQAVKLMRVDSQDMDSFVPFADMDNYVAFSPDSWAAIQAYIGKLKLLAQQKCQP